jgi:hypothetical protein
MQHLHRSTLWRRKQKAPAKRGRKRTGHADEKFNLRLLARIFAYLARTGSDGHVAPRHTGWRSECPFVSMAGVRAFDCKADVLLAEREILQEFKGDNFAPIGLLIVSAWDAFGIDVRRRKRSLRDREKNEAMQLSAAKQIGKKEAGDLAKMMTLAVSQICRDYRISRDEAKKMVSSAIDNGEPWIKEFTDKDVQEGIKKRRGSFAAGCPSKVFRISPRMVSYWRRFDTFDIGMDMRHICKLRLPHLMREADKSRGAVTA